MRRPVRVRGVGMALPGGLRFRSIAIVLLCISGAIFATAYSMLEKERELLMKTARQQAVSLTKASAIVFTNTFIYEELEMLDETDMVDYLSYYVSDVMRTDTRILAFAVLDKRGEVVANNSRSEAWEDVGQLKGLSGLRTVVVGEGYDAALAVSMPLAIESKRWGYCRLVFSLENIERSRVSARNEILLIAGLCLLISALLVGIVIHFQVKALKKLSGAMERFTVNKDFSRPFPELPARKDEIGQLQQSFAWMVRRLRDEEEERARAEEQMFHTEKMATIGKLTASIAHEINNPLGGVILCFNNLTKGELDEQAREQHIEVIHSGIERIRKIMRDLLDYSRQSSLVIQPADVEDVVRKSVSLLELFSRKRHVRIEVTLPDELPQVPMDSAKMQQVVVNLLVNAVHATPEGGSIIIEGYAEKDWLTLMISDTGPGIPEEIRERIFDPFYTTKDVGEGTGLGLALAKSLTEQHGGRLVLAKSDKEGSVFAIHLPRREKDR